VDSDQVFRESLKLFLEKECGYKKIREASDFNGLVQRSLLERHALILMGILLPGVDGITATKHLLWQYSYDLRIIAITNPSDKICLLDLIGAGFRGCVFKDSVYDEIDSAIQRVLGGKLYFDLSLPIE